ncbi:hypothetical protein CPC08DRAFT_110585 [Agrocybe pediades]|nr:hypothetical protein CPC08DRAFT_110585 [Agrocybe pediades]
MTTVFARDREFDLTLESDARLISVLVAVAVAVLVLATAIFLYGYRVLRVMRSGLHHPGNTSKKSLDSEKLTGSVRSDSKRSERIMPTSSTFPDVYGRQATAPVRPPRPPVMAPTPNPLRKSPSVPHRPMAAYNNIASVAPPAAAATRHHRRQYTSPPGVVTPHIAEWMKVADKVVGRHPYAQPLCTRVATQEEVDLISGHVYIPWAYTGPGVTQPTPVKVMKPGVLIAKTQSNVLKDVSNTRVKTREGQPAASTSNTKRSAHKKSAHRINRKENTAAGHHSLDPSGRR